MGRIKGHYEWDDDGLIPGQKKEGGLHQNLFDGEGKLKGSARFVPDDGSEDDFVVTENVFLDAEQRRLTREQEERAEFIAEVLFHLIGLGIAKATPIAKHWWRETARPAIGAPR